MAVPVVFPLAIGALGVLALLAGGADDDAAPGPGPGPGPGVSPGARLPWNVTSDATGEYQIAINATLKNNGYNLIVVDKKLGPITCAAGRFAAESLGNAGLHPSAAGADCQSYGAAPTRSGEPAPGSADSCPADMLARASQASATGDPATIRAVAADARAAGCRTLASAMEAEADLLQAIFARTLGGEKLGTGLDKVVDDILKNLPAGAQVGV